MGHEIDDDFIKRRTTEVVLADGGRIRLRPIVPADRDELVRGFERLSAESRYRRFMSPIKVLTPKMLGYLTEIDYADHFAWAAFDLDEPGEPGVGVARYIRLRDEPTVAEAAVTVVDDHHGRGIGTILLQALAAVALQNGITRFRAYALAGNRPALELLEDLGARSTGSEGGNVVLETDLPASADAIRETPLYDMLRAIARGEAPPLIDPTLRASDATLSEAPRDQGDHT